jgi:hypothetical protein
MNGWDEDSVKKSDRQLVHGMKLRKGGEHEDPGDCLKD